MFWKIRKVTTQNDKIACKVINLKVGNLRKVGGSLSKSKKNKKKLAINAKKKKAEVFRKLFSEARQDESVIIVSRFFEIISLRKLF